MLSETTQSDLEQLLAEVDNGWCAYSNFETSDVAVSFGVGGCLVEEMHRILLPLICRGDNYVEYRQRQNALVEALGFSDHEAMFAWNDKQRDPDVIKRRIKDALNAA
jgi:hypothetical protein